jgi:hypothetical protein
MYTNTSHLSGKARQQVHCQKHVKNAVGRIIFADTHILISRTCEFVSLNGKKDFVKVIKNKDFEMGR